MLIAVGVAGTIAGFALFKILQKLLSKRLVNDKSQVKSDIIQDARAAADQRRRLESERVEEDLLIQKEQLEADIHERQEDLKIADEDLQGRHRGLQLEENRLKKIEQDAERKLAILEAVRADYDTVSVQLDDQKTKLIEGLEERAGSVASQVVSNIQTNLVELRQIESQKRLKFQDEELEASVARLSNRVMARATSRYAPDFFWPKSTNSVELTDASIIERISSDETTLLANLKEKGEIEVDLLEGQDHQSTIIKLAGGAGINREAVRLTLEELLLGSPNKWDSAGRRYDFHRQQLEEQAVKLGQQAVYEVQLADVHPEIQKLVGYLNWRTSYRQNQWHHTVEVAKLAGLIASEVGLDAEQAKRVGLLHDIGKAIDYRIEGSHAVISGDYADRFGESQLICDTVMSHHNDLVLETPLAYVLKSADTLSGARPGARVNLEEGYQTRLSGIESAIRSFTGVTNIAIMNGAREVHVEVNHKRVRDRDLENLSRDMAKKVAEDVAFPGEIKILVSRRFEVTAVA